MEGFARLGASRRWFAGGRPIALCEVQGYVYAAWHHAANMAEALGYRADAQLTSMPPSCSRARSRALFWCEELRTYALALDGDKRPCRVRTSNAGHCLFAGIAREDRAKRVAETLLAKSFSGWGIRTVAAGGEPVTTRCRITTDRFGRTITRSSRRALPATAHRARADDSDRPVRRDRFPRTAAAAGTVLRLRTAARRGAHALSGRVLPAGVGGRLGVHAAAGPARLDVDATAHKVGLVTSPPPRIRLPPPHRQPLGRRRVGGSRLHASRA